MRLMLDVSYSHRGPVDREFWCIIRTVRIEDLLGVGVVSRAVILPADPLPQLYSFSPSRQRPETDSESATSVLAAQIQLHVWVLQRFWEIFYRFAF